MAEPINPNNLLSKVKGNVIAAPNIYFLQPPPPPPVISIDSVGSIFHSAEFNGNLIFFAKICRHKNRIFHRGKFLCDFPFYFLSLRLLQSTVVKGEIIMFDSGVKCYGKCKIWFTLVLVI